MKRFICILLFACGAPTTSEELDMALTAWGVLDMCPIKLSTVSQRKLEDWCNATRGPDVPAEAIMYGCSNAQKCEVMISDNVPLEKRQGVINHEVGHILRGKRGHLECSEGTDVMCSHDGATWPTERDRKFVGAP